MQIPEMTPEVQAYQEFVLELIKRTSSVIDSMEFGIQLVDGSEQDVDTAQKLNEHQKMGMHLALTMLDATIRNPKNFVITNDEEYAKLQKSGDDNQEEAEKPAYS